MVTVVPSLTSSDEIDIPRPCGDAERSEPHERHHGDTRLACAIAGVMILAAALRLRQSLAHKVWLDDLYTLTLVAGDELGRMLSVAMRGVDGNPPLYLLLAWTMARLSPAPVEVTLFALNLVFCAGGFWLMFGVARRMASPSTAAVALALVCTVSTAPVYALIALRTYALYFLLLAATYRAAIDYSARPNRARAFRMGAAGLLAVASHSFAGLYVLATLGTAALVAWIRGQRADGVRAFVAALPALAATSFWIALSFPIQAAVASPYGWISRPDLALLLQAVSGDAVLSLVALGAGLGLAIAAPAVRHRLAALLAADAATATAFGCAAAYAALTLAAWVASYLTTPVFSLRYFTPNIIVTATILLPWLERARRRVGRPLAASAALLIVLVGAGEVGCGSWTSESAIPCLDESGQPLEAGLEPGLPVVAESPDVWLDRRHYTPERAIVFPLDWSVVLNHPDKSRHNAMDFHIVALLRDWDRSPGGLGETVRATPEILARAPRFLVLNEASRSWFDDLRASTPITATPLASTASCTLWRVTRTGAR